MRERSAIVILGSPNDNNGKLSNIALSRCDVAFAYLQMNHDTQIICTGGFGEHFNRTQFPHALYCKQYLMSKGVAEKQFLALVESRFTFEDATLAQPVLACNSIESLIVVTSDFHLKRVKLIFNTIYSHLSLDYLSAHAPMLADELAGLEAHEEKAMVRERRNLIQYLN